MPYTQPQLSLATIKYVETQIRLFADMANKAIGGMEQLVDLNLRSTRAALEESTMTARQFIAARQPQELFTLLRAQVAPSAHNVFTYGSRLIHITSTTQSELSQVAEARIGEVSRTMSKLVENVTNIAPVAPEKVMSLMTHAFNTANADFQQRTKANIGPAQGYLNAAANLAPDFPPDDEDLPFATVPPPQHKPRASSLKK